MTKPFTSNHQRNVQDNKDEIPKKPNPVPLKSVSVIASVVHAVAQVEITQVYKNEEDSPIEVIYFFPVNSNGAVTHFQAEIDGRVIKVSPSREIV
jgi:hypothetical protein